VPHPLDADCLLAAVADGQGGQAGAAEAAQLACRVIRDLASESPPRQCFQVSPWLNLLRAVDRQVAEDPQAGFCTLAAVAITSTSLRGASSGDSAVVLFAGSRPMQILTAGQKKNPPVGSGAAEFVPFAASLALPWTVLLLTDGAWKYAGWDFLQRLDPYQPAEQLIRLVRAKVTLQGSKEPDTYRGLQDDLTLVVLQGAP
jgi:hypothetical protein